MVKKYFVIYFITYILEVSIFNLHSANIKVIYADQVVSCSQCQNGFIEGPFGTVKTKFPFLLHLKCYHACTGVHKVYI